jgi:hypothetical protein
MKTYNKFKILFLLTVLFSLTLLSSCEDAAPTEYTPSYVVEAILIVNQPIQDIYVKVTQSLRDSFIVDNSYLKDAKVQISGDNQIFNLELDPRTNKSYYYPDTSYKVKGSIEYQIKITLSNGKIFTGKTQTPEQIEWISRSPKFIQYPKDLNNYKSDVKISWTKAKDIQYYLLRIKPLDTLNYGKYLSPSTLDSNERILNNFNKNNKNYFREITSWAFLPTTETPIVISTFKWYGYQEVTIFASDENYTKWALQLFASSSLNPQLTTIEGGAFGCFGSASIIKDTSFVLKYTD